MPVSWAGPRTETATSLPNPSGDRPAAIAADSPPLEPPGVRSGSYGFKVRPIRRLSVSVQYDISGRLVLPSRTAPAPRSRATAVASLAGTWSSNSSDPRVVRTPAVSNESLTVKGTPASGPGTGRLAASNACSPSTVTNALTRPPTLSILSKWVCTTSTAVTSPARIRPASDVASNQTSSSTSTYAT